MSQKLVLPLQLLNVALSCINDLHVLAHILQHGAACIYDIFVLLIASPARISPSPGWWFGILWHVHGNTHLFVPLLNRWIDRLLATLLPSRGRSLIGHDRLTLSSCILLRRNLLLLNGYCLSWLLLLLLLILSGNQTLSNKESRSLLSIHLLSLLLSGPGSYLP